MSLIGILFESDTLSPQDAAYLVYFQNRILAQGIQPSFYSSPGYPTHASDVKPWVMNHPGERAQQIWASALYLQNQLRHQHQLRGHLQRAFDRVHDSGGRHQGARPAIRRAWSGARRCNMPNVSRRRRIGITSRRN